MTGSRNRERRSRGDLNAAIAIYEKIAAEASAPRGVRAKVLLRLAGCDEKLGRQAQQVYERILHDYADQPVAAQARKRLAAIQLILIRNGDIGRVYTTMNGVLIFQDRSTKASEGDMSFGSFDADGHIRDWRQLEFRGGLGAGITNVWPSLSPDGNRSFTSPQMMIPQKATGGQRILYRSLERSISCHFEAKLPEVYCSVVSTLSGLRKRTNLIAVSTDSGAVEPIAAIEGPRVLIESDPDGQIFYFSANRAFAGRTPLFLWDERTHKESPISLLPATTRLNGHR